MTRKRSAGRSAKTAREFVAIVQFLWRMMHQDQDELTLRNLMHGIELSERLKCKSMYPIVVVITIRAVLRPITMCIFWGSPVQTENGCADSKSECFR